MSEVEGWIMFVQFHPEVYRTYMYFFKSGHLAFTESQAQILSGIPSIKSMLGKCNQGIFPQDLKLFLPVSVKMMAKASGVQLQQRHGPSVTLGNALLKEVTWSFMSFIC